MPPAIRPVRSGGRSPPSRTPRACAVAPTGYDAALLHAYSLLVPETAADVRRFLGHVLDTRAGRFAELAVITELLQTTTRGDNLELEQPLRARLGRLLEQR
ncbi:hypothetical protein ACIQGZ_14285 [Streptomyces sp. NPDC092296]|uniref:hypothetical protein n=1 Tax=Streptomyces sp. NPDC092296 TaxID=3366012 RepID=UPI0037F419FA